MVVISKALAKSAEGLLKAANPRQHAAPTGVAHAADEITVGQMSMRRFCHDYQLGIHIPHGQLVLPCGLEPLASENFLS
jgi:hypothetical protein